MKLIQQYLKSLSKENPRLRLTLFPDGSGSVDTYDKYGEVEETVLFFESIEELERGAKDFLLNSLFGS